MSRITILNWFFMLRLLSTLGSFSYLLTYIGLVVFFTLVYWLFPSSLGLAIDNFVEALYFSVVTMTTLGFGDISPKTVIGQVLVTLQVFLGVMLLGLFLNALSHARAVEIKANEHKIVEDRKEELRKSLERHACLILDVFKSGNPHAWDKHAKHSAQIDELEDFCRKTYFYAFSKKSSVTALQMKMLLEVCHQNYETLLALTPVAAEISSIYLLEWSSLISNVRNLSQEYERIISTPDDHNFPQWPTCCDIAIQVQELINVSLFICKKDVMTGHCTES